METSTKKTENAIDLQLSQEILELSQDICGLSQDIYKLSQEIRGLSQDIFELSQEIRELSQGTSNYDGLPNGLRYRRLAGRGLAHETEKPKATKMPF